MPHLLSVSLAPSPASVVLEWSRFQLLAAIRPVSVSGLESHWTRQKCSGPPANTLPPWPSVDGPSLLYLPAFPWLLLDQGTAPSVRDVSTMITWRNNLETHRVLHLLQSLCHIHGRQGQEILNAKLTTPWLRNLMPQLKEMESFPAAEGLGWFIFPCTSCFLFIPIKITHHKKVLFCII